MWFKALSGLKFSLEESELILIGSIPNVELFANELGCKVGSSLPFTLLGLPLVHHVTSPWLP